MALFQPNMPASVPWPVAAAANNNKQWRNAGVYNLKLEKDLVGDNVTDETDKINEGIVEGSQLGLAIYLPQGDYRTSDIVILNNNDIRMYGDGDLTKIKPLFAGFDAINVGDSDNNSFSGSGS